MEKTYLILCDIDDTLFRANTTYQFLAYVLRPFVVRSWQLKLLTWRMSPVFWTLTVLGKFWNRDVVRERALLLLRDLPASLLEQQAPRFYEDCLTSKINPEVYSLLQTKPGDRFLLSSTLDPVAQVIGERLHMTAVASALENSRGVLTGRLSKDLSGRKHQVARELSAAYPGRRLVVITDNQSDYDLVAMADDRFVVVKKESDRKFWSDLQPSYLRG